MTDLISLFFKGSENGVRGILEQLVDFVYRVSDKLKLPIHGIFGGLAIACGIVAAVFGYKLFKVLSSLAASGVGLLAGKALYDFLAEKVSFIPAGKLRWVAGGIFAILLFILAFKQHKFILAALGAAFTYYIVMFYFGGIVFLSIGAALVAALLCVYFEKFFAILSTSFGGALIAVTFAGSLLPDKDFLRLYTMGERAPSKLALLAVAGIGLICAAIQFISNKYNNYDDLGYFYWY